MTRRMGTGWLAGLLLAALSVAPAAMAGDKTFFYNITSDDTWKAGMAVSQAARAMEEGHDVIEYGEVIGRTSRKVEAGEHVHTHNIKSLRV